MQARVAAGFGSTIEATGSLAIGNGAAVDGFFSDGVLNTNQHTVTIHDKNSAVLGSLTALGNGVSEGSLVAGTANPADAHAHFLLEEGKNLVGRGMVAGHFRNHGSVIGDGDASGEQIVFDASWTVSGIGSFENALFNGTFAPGLSPGVVQGANLTVGGTLEIELGGVTPGHGAGHHDQVIDAGAFTLREGATLALKPFGGFLPSPGDEFEIVTALGGIDGEFDYLSVDPWFAAQGLGFVLETTEQSLLAKVIAGGDFNLDGVVDGSDFLKWQRGESPNPFSASDLESWKANFGSPSAASASAPVPEPAGLPLAALAAAGAVGVRSGVVRQFGRKSGLPAPARMGRG